MDKIEMPEKMECEITTNCLCYKSDEDGNEILDQYGQPEIADYCYGDCHEFALEDFYGNVLAEWLIRNGYSDTDTLRVDGSGMGWTRSSGWTLVEASKAHEALGINGDYTLNFTLEGKDLYAIRYSHDEPMGTGRFVFSLAPNSCDKCGEPVDPEIHAEELGMCVECSNKYFDHADE